MTYERVMTVCIPCVMCGACFKGAERDNADKGTCPFCRHPLGSEDIVCPNCYQFLPSALTSTDIDCCEKTTPNHLPMDKEHIL